ncbi:DNA internalization-related competence protein ComEC/Rec2 [Solemya velum gill symbiont]|uniref:DNA internalization-related competence protein ComEC/Rec2 n=1 Tax=Solemya velum gill symbiont TaxID=2340 RepID=UPI0009976837|nr:DNA internalization-related competence protein ComEC/Rec2 [Solemya velum gill symbiont]OOZ15436.1 DNA internalization-related competence protein ComEC/Rec2 [Solemya velum gill symbiont]OOZ20014.1 DNA internalization-related competence protein ComEC/Rec2 [Solemya velum gill symbiont]OOZ22811.1 DNA internalization-related competence protein ComEC/Rec2 [Solemya velum gill symbiont]OOZ24999.1 DNA internalization-related competence protein ComEC/Rec2 [Solemya velum gill symbiont]OOZ29840.1 DNA i
MKLELNAISLLLGMLSLSLFRELPGHAWFIPAGIALTLLLLFRKALPLSFLLAGFLWAGLDGHNYIQSKLPTDLHGTDFTLTGKISSFPKGDNKRITFLVTSTAPVSERWPGGRIRLSWRDPVSIPTLGDEWSFRVRLFTPSGMLNKGGFDYERWLYTDNIVATGYVRGDEQRLNGGAVSVDRVRHYFRERIDALANQQQHQAAGLLKALLIGDRSGIDQQQSQSFQATGTSHLIAISGLHIGLVAGACWFLASFLWSRSVRLMRRVPAPLAGAIAAILGAFLYAALAGFSLPTQRALIMTIVFAGATCLKVYYPPLVRLAVALILVVIADPRCIWQPAFWFSFSAVLLLITLFQYRRNLSSWQLLIIAQLFLTALMLPLQATFGMPLSLISPLVNWIAVPWFSLLLVPATLVSAILSLFDFNLPVQIYLQLADWTLALINLVAEYNSPLVIGQQHILLTLAAVIAVFLFVRYFSWRSLIPLLMLYLLSWARLPVEKPYLKLVVFDVGQGQSLLIETENHRLLYDLGPAFPSGFNTAESVVIPYLQAQGINQIDKLILSHDDKDHTGAADSFLTRIMTLELLEGQAVESTGHHGPRACRAGDSWQWDGILFEIVHPHNRDSGISDNDMSCVLMVKSDETTLLITGDITKPVEKQLLENADLGNVGLVTLPHHGSNSSSADVFVNSLQADYGVVSSGWRNRYGHPRKPVIDRWSATGTRIFNTTDSGMQVFRWERGSATPVIDSWRTNHASFWNR